jgi:hypothetical protein
MTNVVDFVRPVTQRASDRAQQDTELVGHTRKLLEHRLERAAKAKRTKYSSISSYSSSSRFHPLMFSSSGAMEGECKKNIGKEGV